ncbi:DUF2334 domain-containing protein [Domibacillus epiphyticus]|uniref:DUF2334 domain-containing protein n=1 Tax=Domibacillus epiphyticus TaxID=1714355 RepID=A0A1V2A6M6_9BACI|nr:polysaccharide deacetylase family protein [Domibacillus epiphyticus]OMP66663.1 hypothetical protein BTO28_11520 [Domibacillus epiphyticus]
MRKKSRNTKNSFILILVISILFPFFFNTPESRAEKNGYSNVLVIYTSSDGEIDEHQRIFDMLISHFTTDVKFISSNEVEKKDLSGVTHLFYYGQFPDRLPSTFHTLLNDYTGSILAIGHNTKQLGTHFDFIDQKNEFEINQMAFTDKKEKRLNTSYGKAINIEVDKGTEILVEGTRADDSASYPILVKNQNHYYYAVDRMAIRETIFLGEALHQMFGKKHMDASRPGYIRIEDVHPMVNPEPLKEIAGILKEKNIPYMIAVIPVYTNPETGEEHFFSDSPELLKVLKQMQEDGGSVILHGYTHQHKLNETGEGFEFWDVEKNTPIYAPASKEFVLKHERDFETREKYEEYMKELENFENEYIHKKVKRGIQELVNYGLYPLAFEAPHYTMSQNGYKVLSESFSTYVGQLQLSDSDWKIMDSTPYITSPSFLKGMQLLPETMGFVEEGNPNALQEIQQKSEMIQITDNGVAGAFYHPYLGADGLKDVLKVMEKIPNLSWIDLKEMDVWVKTENVDIYTKNGEVITDVKQGALLLSSIDFPLYHLKEFIDMVIWGIAILGGLAVISFIMFTVHLHSRKAKMEG